MRRLMLLRHAKTENDAPSGQDQDRRLDERGRMDAAGIGDFIASHPPFPELVQVSTAVRTHQTWEAAWTAMQEVVAAPQVELLPELYGADPGQILHAIHTAVATDPARLLLIGHNPGLHELSLALSDGSGDAAAHRALAENLPTSGLVIFDFAVDDWADVAFRRGKLVSFTSPKLLKRDD
jgi:phosphohistidine phosphatase